MCLKEDIQKLRNQIKREGIKNALQHDAIINFTDHIHNNEDLENAIKRKHGRY